MVPADQDLKSGTIGKAGTYDVAIKNGALVLTVSETDVLGTTNLVRTVGMKQVLDALKAAIPGVLDDEIIDIIEGALGL
jgi:hypothetical protein